MQVKTKWRFCGYRSDMYSSDVSVSCLASPLDVELTIHRLAFEHAVPSLVLSRQETRLFPHGTLHKWTYPQVNLLKAESCPDFIVCARCLSCLTWCFWQGTRQHWHNNHDIGWCHDWSCGPANKNDCLRLYTRARAFRCSLQLIAAFNGFLVVFLCFRQSQKGCDTTTLMPSWPIMATIQKKWCFASISVWRGVGHGELFFIVVYVIFVVELFGLDMAWPTQQLLLRSWPGMVMISSKPCLSDLYNMGMSPMCFFCFIVALAPLLRQFWSLWVWTQPHQHDNFCCDHDQEWSWSAANNKQLSF
jgi:hypothetical protein